jgi:hypothetical protein
MIDHTGVVVSDLHRPQTLGQLLRRADGTLSFSIHLLPTVANPPPARPHAHIRGHVRGCGGGPPPLTNRPPAGRPTLSRPGVRALRSR